MATVATATLRLLAQRWEGAIGSAVLSGIVGDTAHKTAPGKHLSYADNRAWFGSGAWPLNASPGDRNPRNKSAAAAIDMSMNRADMIRVTNNLVRVFNNRGKDPRAKFITAFNGTTDGVNAKRWALTDGSITWTDNSHTWHVHGETPYDQVDNPEMPRAWMSAIQGESIEQYTGGGNADEEEDDMGKGEDAYEFLFNGKRPSGMTDTHNGGIKRVHVERLDQLDREAEAKTDKDLQTQIEELRQQIQAATPKTEIDYEKLAAEAIRQAALGLKG